MNTTCAGEAARETHHLQIMSAIKGLWDAVAALDSLLNEIRGEYDKPDKELPRPEPGSIQRASAKSSKPSLAYFLNSSDGELQEIAERIVSLAGAIRQELF